MKLLLEINLDNAGMHNVDEVIDAITDSLMDGTASDEEALALGDDNIIRDVNGNKVGRWYVDA